MTTHAALGNYLMAGWCDMAWCEVDYFPIKAHPKVLYYCYATLVFQLLPVVIYYLWYIVQFKHL